MQSNPEAADADKLEGPPGPADPVPVRRKLRLGLSWKLLWFTIAFVMVTEVLIYVPSISGFRIAWLVDRLSTAEAAAVVLAASEWTDVPRRVQDDLLAAVGADAIALRSGEVSRLLAAVEMPPEVDRTSDLRAPDLFGDMLAALDTLIVGGDRTIRVVGETERGATLDIVMNERPLRAAMLGHSINLLALSLLISACTAALVFLTLNRLLVAPMRRITQNMIAFSEAPEDPARVIRPSGRGDEIGSAEERLAAMQTELQSTLLQQRRLADLGLAVAKISHDLRNMLASAQLFSDRIGAVPDPSVQKFAPKLVAALDRAIAYCQASLSYGKPGEPAPERRLVRLDRLVEDVAEVLGIDQQPMLRWENRVPQGLEVDADPEHLFRILVNLGRNAIQAMEGNRDAAVVRRITVEGRRDGGVVTIRVRDTGPGVAPRARAHLFQAFHGSARPGGTGLGLAIAAELIRAHGGTISLLEGGPGATFQLVIPDRPLEFARPSRANTA